MEMDNICRNSIDEKKNFSLQVFILVEKDFSCLPCPYMQKKK